MALRGYVTETGAGTDTDAVIVAVGSGGSVLVAVVASVYWISEK